MDTVSKATRRSRGRWKLRLGSWLNLLLCDSRSISPPLCAPLPASDQQEPRAWSTARAAQRGHWEEAVSWLSGRRPAFKADCLSRSPQGHSPCCLWGEAGRLWGPPDSGHRPAGWTRTCLSSGRRLLSQPAAPAGRGGGLGSPMGRGLAGLAPQDTGWCPESFRDLLSMDGMPPGEGAQPRRG